MRIKEGGGEEVREDGGCRMEEGGRLRTEHSQRVGSGCGLSFGTDSRACARASVERVSRAGRVVSSLVLVGYGRTVVRTTPANPPIPYCRRLLSYRLHTLVLTFTTIHCTLQQVPRHARRRSPSVYHRQPLLPRLVGWTRQGSRLLSYSTIWTVQPRGNNSIG